MIAPGDGIAQILAGCEREVLENQIPTKSVIESTVQCQRPRMTSIHDEMTSCPGRSRTGEKMRSGEDESAEEDLRYYLLSLKGSCHSQYLRLHK